MEILKATPNMSLKQLYDLTKNPEAERMSDHIGEIIPVDQYMIRTEVKGDDGEFITITSIMGNGKIYSTNSAIFSREFDSILEMAQRANAKVNRVKIAQGESKRGRPYITCVFVD